MVNSTQEPASTHDAEVMVELSGCATEDADAVFRALRISFACDRASDDKPQEVAGPRPTVWTSTFDVSDVRAVPGPARLSAPVIVDVQGGYWAVARLRENLAGAFAVQVVGTAAGDQEEEVQLRLETRR